MNIFFPGDGMAHIAMPHYIQEALDAFESINSPMKRRAPTPSTKTLFNVDKKSPLLPTDKAEVFHSIVAKLLYVAKRVRLDIQPTIVFCVREYRPQLNRIGTS